MKPSRKQTYLIFVFCLSCSTLLHSQDIPHIDLDISLKKNAIYGSVGWEIFSVSASVYGERILGKGIESWGAETFVRLGIIGLAGGSKGNVLAIDGGLLVPGLSRSKYGLLEIAVGFHPTLNGVVDFPPVGGTLAYRYQKPQGNFIFRFGAGIPEVLFAGIGFCF